MAIAVVVGMFTGVLSAVVPYSLFDVTAMLVALAGVAMPVFWLGMLVILLFAVQLQILPVSGRGTLAHLVLPGLTLAMWPLTLTARLTRSGMLDVLSQDYIRTARAEGLGEVAVTSRPW